jgi:hypothetical protein
MRQVFDIDPATLLTSLTEPLRGLEPRPGSPTEAQLQSIIGSSQEIFLSAARPRGLFQTIELEEFDSIYFGDGGNDDDTPLEHVVEDAQSLALFAVTLGGEVSDRISGFFDGGNLAEGYILDQLASLAADELAQVAARRLRAAQESGPDTSILPYSPGYCGWNVSGQRALFARLEPEELGITINASCLMHPLKSVSGVLVTAPVSAHDFSPGFPCCASCTTLDCQDRIASIRPGASPTNGAV